MDEIKKQTFREIIDLMPQILTASMQSLQREKQEITHDRSYYPEFATISNEY